LLPEGENPGGTGTAGPETLTDEQRDLPHAGSPHPSTPHSPSE